MGFGRINLWVDNVNTANINGITMPVAYTNKFKTNLRFIPILIDTTQNGNVVMLSAKSF